MDQGVEDADGKSGLFRETLTSMKRAGADIIITYHAIDAAKWLKG